MANDPSRSEGDRAVFPPPLEPNPEEALLAQQTALLNAVMQQMKDLNTRVEAAVYGVRPLPAQHAALAGLCVRLCAPPQQAVEGF
ncbi:hypothetical protein CYMTET_36847 [Cymbomonas tetramitiformis]|uniref:Uncharacterized protein n=1 Tax=Cymbomonas tetramitiformis TaxID=36881 RepID=A0AAE0F6L1_9CHLO|nr:hypothetical protein CYMTET_36847 [Cymbomonas tetramitiformis]